MRTRGLARAGSIAVLAALIIGCGDAAQPPTPATGIIATPVKTAEAPAALPMLQKRRTIQGADISAAAWSPDSTQLATLAFQSRSTGATIEIWDAQTGQRTSALTPTLDPREDPRAIAWSPTGTQLAAVYGAPVLRLHLLDTQTLTETISWEIGFPPDYLFHDSIIAINPAGDTIATTSIHTTTLWTMDGTATRELPVEGRQYRSVAWSPDGQHLATTDANGSARIWNTQSGTLEQTIAAHTAQADGIAWSADSTTLVTGGHDGVVQFWDAQTGTLLHTIPPRPEPNNQIVKLAWNPATNALAILTAGNTVIIWDTSTQTAHQEMTIPGAQSLHWSPNGQMLAIVVGEGVNVVEVWGE